MNVSKIVVEKIVKEMESGSIPWQKPWISLEKQNLVSKKAYQGINRLLLAGDPEDYYLTFNQIQTLKGHLKRGSKGNFVIFWKFFDVKKTITTGSEVKESIDTIPMLRYYNVFKLSDTENIKRPEVGNKNNQQNLTIEEYIKSINPNIVNQGSRACYSPLEDVIYMPELSRFNDAGSYYRTLLHEIIHWTGSERRLKRFNDKEGSQLLEYGKEELTAEVGSSILAHTFNIGSITPAAGYIQSWLKQIKGDNRLIFSALSKAEKAIDYLKNKNVELKEAVA